MFGTGDGNNEQDMPLPPSMGNTGNSAAVEADTSEDEDENLPKKKKKKGKTRGTPAPTSGGGGGGGGIKTTPLILLVLMVGTTLLPALIYAGDYLSSFLAKNNVAGAIGFRLGIGAVPKKRVVSFYEKHAPEKLNDVPDILSKHYGKYPTLIKKLERKYQDYGYFVGWEEDEAPVRIAMEHLKATYDVWLQQYWVSTTTYYLPSFPLCLDLLTSLLLLPLLIAYHKRTVMHRKYSRRRRAIFATMLHSLSNEDGNSLRSMSGLCSNPSSVFPTAPLLKSARTLRRLESAAQLPQDKRQDDERIRISEMMWKINERTYHQYVSATAVGLDVS